MENFKSTAKVAASVALGVIAGAAIGVLFAPHKGSKTREKIAGNAKKMAKDLKNKVTGEIDSLKDEANNLEKRAEDKLLGLKNGMEATAKDFVKN